MRRTWVLIVIVSLTAGVLTIGPGAEAATPELVITPISAKPQYVTGGDVLVELSTKVKKPRFSVGGTLLTAHFKGGKAWLVQDLRVGPSRIVARAAGQTATLDVVNHPTSGPVLSGPHLPLLCTASEDEPERATRRTTCNGPTTVSYQYKTSDDEFVSVSSPDDVPSGRATTATFHGRTVPYVVRVERGVINRTPYSFAMLDDPLGWNHRLVYQFGGGCGTSYSQGSPLGTNVVDEALLSAGYAVATANFNTFQTSCNEVLSAETAMMVKEHVTESIGAPRLTIGSGGSGGAIQQLSIAQNYPGILDAISPVVPFPDAISIAPGVSDCGLLNKFYEGGGAAFTREQRLAVNGHRTLGTCALWISSFLSTIDPEVGCDPRIPKEQIFSETNWRGIRCTLQDLNRNTFGIDPSTGFANRPLDNVGVQYGLRALDEGIITVDQFLDLNESIGGYDINGEIVADRERATAAVMRRAYATGRVLSGGGNIREIPIITVNLYSDPFGDIHDRFRLFTIRERLRGPNGKGNSNHIIWTRPSTGNLAESLTGVAFDPAEAIKLLDRWASSGKRPAEAVDNCTDADGDLISGPTIYDDPGPCRDLYPVYGDPRTAAGAPLINDRLKCRLRPTDPARYRVELTSEQAQRLQEIFPSGVCNWRRPGVGQVPLAKTWINYNRPPFRVAGQ